MWIVSWRFNGKAYIEKYEDYEIAIKRFNKLINKRQRPSIHQKASQEKLNEEAKQGWYRRFFRRIGCSHYIYCNNQFVLDDFRMIRELIEQLIYNIRIRYYHWKHRHDKFHDQLDKLWLRRLFIYHCFLFYIQLSFINY